MKPFFWVIAIVTTIGAAAQASPIYQVVILEPPGYHPTYAAGIAEGQQVGYSDASQGGPTHALLWSGSQSSYVDLNPSGVPGSRAFATDGIDQVGVYEPGNHAALWHGSANSFVDLHPSGYDLSRANGVGGGQQVGSATPAGSQASHAMVWFGSAQSAVDLNPAGAPVSVAFATDGLRQAGYYRFASGVDHASIWSGTAGSMVDIHPSGWNSSYAQAASSGRQAGYVFQNGGIRHAALWSGSQNSFADLNPTQLGFGISEILGMAGDYQVGDAGDIYHAIIWEGSADSAVDLQQFLSPEFTSSRAFAVDSSGNAVGVASSPAGSVAVMWIVPEPSMAGLLVMSLFWAVRRHR